MTESPAVSISPDLSNKRSFLEKMGEPFKKVLDEDLDRPMEVQRMAQIALAQRNYLYWQGKQYLVPKMDFEGRTLGWKSLSGGVGRQPKDKKNPRFSSVYNHVYSDGAKFMAVIGQQIAKLKAVADDPGNIDFRNAAESGDMAIELLHRWWNIPRVQRQIAFHSWVTGPVFLYPQYVSDGYRYGWVEEPRFETETMTESAGYRCPACQEKSPVEICQTAECERYLKPIDPSFFEPASTVTLPVELPPKKYARGRVELNVCSSMFVTVPFGRDDISKVEWLAWRRVLNDYTIKGMHGIDVKERSGSELDRFTEEVQDEIESPEGNIGRAGEKRPVYEQRWLTPDVYHAFPKSTRRALQKEFPNGLMIARVGEKLLDIRPAKLIDEWSVCVTGTGENIESYPISHYIISPQDDVNALMNMAKEITLRHIPRALVDSSLIDREKWNEKPPVVGELLLTRMGGNMNLGQMVKDLPRADFPPELLNLLQVFFAQREEINGVRGVLSGGGKTQHTTWRALAQAKNMALMQLAPVILNTHDGIAGATMNGVRQLEKFGTGEEVIPPPKGVAFSKARSLRLEEVTATGWHVELADAIPMSYGEKVQRVQELAQETPQVAQAIGLNHPMNAPEMQTMLGVEDLYCPGQNEREAAEALINDLLGEQPFDDIDPMTGAPLRKSSREPLPFEHKNHAAFAEILRTWCNSDIGRQMRVENPAGYENVQLHGLAQDQAAMAAMQPPLPEGAPAAGPAAPPNGEQSPLSPVETASTGPIPPVEEGL